MSSEHRAYLEDRLARARARSTTAGELRWGPKRNTLSWAERTRLDTELARMDRIIHSTETKLMALNGGDEHAEV